MKTIRTTALLGLAALVLLAGSARLLGGPGAGSSPSPGLAEADKLNAALIGAAVDAAGNVYVADSAKNIIQKISPNGAVATLAGSEGVRGSADGFGKAAQFNGPQAVAVDPSGNLYVADAGNHTIRKITSAGAVTTLAGAAGMSGNADGTGSDARFASPQGLAIDLRGNLYVADTRNHSVRKITSFGVVSTLAGAGVPGNVDGAGREARFYAPTRLALDPYGNIYVTDTGNNLIRKLTEFGAVSTLAGTAARQGRGDLAATYSDGIGSAARFNAPDGIVVNDSGEVIVADSGNSKIRKVTRGGVVSTLDGVSCPQRHRDFSDRRSRGRRGNSVDVFFFGGGDRPTGNYIGGGVPGPGDIDIRPGKPAAQPVPQIQTMFLRGVSSR